MSSHGHRHQMASSRAAPPRQMAPPPSQHGYGAAPAMPIAPGVAAPAGTFQPGTKIQVGSHRVVIQKYLSEGGFAHVYLVKMPKPVDGTDLAVLKRVAVPDKEALKGMRTEVETMKRLKGHRMIVTYIDSHASELKGGGYEVFLLMEFCDGGGLIDFMNTRLQHRLTEPEILNIFCDIAEGLACMHYLKPALLHRDLKIENVLITMKGSSRRFKLCDFGSSAAPTPAPTSVVECRLMDEDIQKHTTLQYRSPEMVDVYRKQPLNEKSDIWALGVFLYKLCYYTTPFEDQGQLAILNASYRFPSSPPFSNRLKRLIASMLKENLESRPNIYQILKEACAMRGREVPVRDIYSGSASRDPQAGQRTSSKDSGSKASPSVGAVFAAPVEEKPKIPEVTPMRRGRPTASPAPSQAAQQRPPSKQTGGDPFAALDATAKQIEEDEISARFPSLDQFSLLHDKGANFDFDSSAPAPAASEGKDTQDHGATERLADEVFAASRSPPLGGIDSRPQSVKPSQAASRVVSQHVEALSKASSGRSSAPPKQQETSRASSIIRSNPDLHAIATQTSTKYVSTGTSTSDLPFEAPMKPTYRVSQVQTSESPSVSRHGSSDRLQEQIGELPSRVSSRGSSSLQQQQSSIGRVPSSGRAPVEDPTPQEDLLDIKSRHTLPLRNTRPHSTHLDANSTMDYLREREALSRPSSRPSPRITPQGPSPGLVPVSDEPSQPEGNDLEFLRSLEGSSQGRGSDAAKPGYRASVGAAPGSRGILGGKLGDAFKKFESNQANIGRAPSPLKASEQPDLMDMGDSQTAGDGGGASGVVDDAEEMTPEMRREMERRQLEEEEQRVEAAQAEYRKRVAAPSNANGPGSAPPPRAMSIQNRVQSLLDEQKVSHVQKTASGYGKYSDAASEASKPEKALPEVPRKPVNTAKPSTAPPLSTHNSHTGPPAISQKQASGPNKPGSRPAAPKKPIHLNSFPTGQRGPSSPSKMSQASPQIAASEQLIAVDLPGQPALDMTSVEKDNYLEDFSQRFPSLSAMETQDRR